jgi:PAS domain S-box-containing protein
MIRRDINGQEIVYLNELRHLENAPLALRKPLTELNEPAVRAALGQEGIVRGLDYRGVPVLASNRIIPNSPWFLTAKIDMDEVDAPLGEWSQLIAVLTTAWMAAAGLALALVWRNRDARFYLQQYMSEAERRALSQRYEYLTKNANDIILVMDQDWRIVEVNDRAVAAYGYEREEFFNLHIWDLFQDSRWSNNGNKTLRPEDDGLRFESVCCRKDGGTFPVEISSSLIQMEDSSLYQYIVRDVAERKEKEKALKESEQQLRFLSSRLLIVQENERRRISKELHDELGHALMILKFQIGSVETKLAKSKKGLRKDCESLLQYVDVLIEDVRRLSWDLSPTVLEQFGLSIAIKNLLEEYRNHYEVHWTPAQLDEINNSFSSLSQVNIYRIFQESLTNIARHAQATQISVGVEKQNNHVAFTIADNGSGFEPRAVMSRESKDRGIGLAAMQERARLTGGRLNIWSQPGAGTKLRFTIPLDKGD